MSNAPLPPAEWQALAPDIVIELASKSRIAQVLAMTAACANWRAAIASVQADAQVWKALLAHRFPRLKVGPPNRLTNRQLYRVQLDVKALRQMPISAPPATPPPAKLRDFTFTIELTLMSHGEDEDGKPRAPRDRMHIGSTDTWVGKLREATSPSISFARFDGAHEIGCQLDLAPFDDDRRVRCCVYLTTPSLQTVKLYDCPGQETGDNVSDGYDATFPDMALPCAHAWPDAQWPPVLRAPCEHPLQLVFEDSGSGCRITGKELASYLRGEARLE